MGVLGLGRTTWRMLRLAAAGAAAWLLARLRPERTMVPVAGGPEPEPGPLPECAAEAGRTPWFGVVGGTLAWLAHLLLAYAVAEFGCALGLQRYVYLGVGAVSWALLGVSAVCLAAAAAAAAAAWRETLRARDEGWPDESGWEGWASFLGAVLSGLFFVIILIQTVPILYYLRDC